jgi:hypothetical protein
MRIDVIGRRVLIGWVLMIQVLFHLCSSTLFIHSHIIDGHEIVHSHFFAGPISEHGHTSDSAESIQNATYSAALSATTTTIDAPLCIVVELISSVTDMLATTNIIHHSLRAPPAVA